MAKSESQSAVTVGQFLAMLLRRWLTIVIAIALCSCVGILLKQHAKPTYEATAVVDITPVAGSGVDPKSISTATEQHVVKSSRVAALAARTLRIPASDSLVSNVRVSSPLDSLVLNVTYQADTAEAAAAGANAFANGYISYRKSAAQAQLDQQANSLQARLDPLLKRFAGLSATSDQRSALQAQIVSLQQQLSVILSSVAQAGRLISTASAPSSTSGPGLLIYAAGGLVFGLIVGVAVAIVRDRRDDTVRSASDLEQTIGEPVLAVVPQVRRPRRNGRRVTTVLSDPRGPEADALRTLALKLVAAQPPSTTAEGSRAITVLGHDQAEMVPAYLAVTFARQGLRTALVGPTEALKDAALLLGVALDGDGVPLSHAGGIEHAGALQLLALGDEVALDSTLRSMSSELNKLREAVDVLVLDCVNVGHLSSALSSARYSDATIVLARTGVTEHAWLRWVDRELSQVGAHIVGAVLLSNIGRREAWPSAVGAAEYADPSDDLAIVATDSELDLIPVVWDPVGSDPVDSDPVGSDLVDSDPVGSDLVDSDPVDSDLDDSDLDDSDPADGDSPSTRSTSPASSSRSLKVRRPRPYIRSGSGSDK